MNIRFLNPAEGEMLEAAQFYEDQAVGLGDRFLDEVEGCVELLLDRPHIGRLVGEFRRFPLRKFPFTLIYMIEDNDSRSCSRFTSKTTPRILDGEI